MKRSIWVKESEKTLSELGLRPASVSVARKINGVFTMADRYAVSDGDFADVVQLLSECHVLYEVDEVPEAA